MFSVEDINVSNAISAGQPDLTLAMTMMSVLFQLLGCCEQQVDRMLICYVRGVFT
jgi:hypothetical protein